MSSDWPYVELGKHTFKIGSGSTPRGGSNVYLDVGETALVRSQNIYNDQFNYEGVVYLTKEAAKGLRNAELKSNDVLLNITGDSVARVCLVPDDILPARVNQHVAIIRPKPNEFNPHFIKYFFSSRQQQTFLLAIANSGGTRNALTKGIIEKLEIPKPSLDMQQRIVEPLVRIDRKIYINQQMNKTLEEMARAIFKSWFVDFDPVHAKAAGNAPAHMDAETAALFPSSFGDDGLPVGWENKTLGDFIEIQNGYAFKSKDWTDEGIPVVKIGSVKPSILDLSNCSFVSAEVAEQKRNFQLRVGDILIGLTGYVGEVGRVPPADKMPMLNQRVGRVIFKRESFEQFVYAAMRLPEFKSFAEIQSHGSAQANVSTKQLQEYPVVFADILLIQKFNALLESYFEKILTNSAENQTLAELRDTLLPKLMSGEISVDNIEVETV